VFKNSYSAYVKHAYWSKFSNISTLNTINLDVNNAEWGIVQGAGYYDTNSDIVIFAQAAEGYEFVDWSDGVTDNPRTINLVSDVELIANFRLEETLVDIEFTESDVVVYVRDNVLYIENIAINYQLYDIFGRKLYDGLEGAVKLMRGVYLIVIGNEVVKIIV
jgi:hypothetical protein